MKKELEQFLDAWFRYRKEFNNPIWIGLGEDLAKYETTHGQQLISIDDLTPIEQHLKLNEDPNYTIGAKIAIFWGYQTYITKHKLASGMGNKQLNKLHERNRTSFINFVRNQESRSN